MRRIAVAGGKGTVVAVSGSKLATSLGYRFFFGKVAKNAIICATSVTSATVTYHNFRLVTSCANT